MLFNQIVLIFHIHIFSRQLLPWYSIISHRRFEIKRPVHIKDAKSASPSTGKMGGGQVQCRGAAYRYIHRYKHTYSPWARYQTTQPPLGTLLYYDFQLALTMNYLFSIRLVGLTSKANVMAKLCKNVCFDENNKS